MDIDLKSMKMGGEYNVQREKGFTLVELMLTVSILALLLGLAVPAMNDFFDKRRVIEAAEAVYSQLQYARSEAIARSTTVSTVIDDNTWAIGVSDTATCNPAHDLGGANPCTLSIDGTPVLKRITGSEFPTITFASDPDTVDFDPRRGTVTPGNNGAITISNNDYALKVIVSTIGRITMCSPSNKFVPGYKECD